MHTLPLHQPKRKSKKKKKKKKKRDHMRRYTYIRPKQYYIISTTLCARTLYFATTVHQHRSSETLDHLAPSPSLASEVASPSPSKAILEYSAISSTTKEQLSTCYRLTRYQRYRSSPTITLTDVTPSPLRARHTTSKYLTERSSYQSEDFHTSISHLFHIYWSTL